MCVLCEEYEFEGKCGNNCGDHTWHYDEPTNGKRMRRCAKCSDTQILKV